MELFVKVIFVILIFNSVCRSFLIAFIEYPRKETKTIGPLILDFIIGILLAIWSGFLLWGGK